MPFTKHDLAKYPFLPKAADYIKELDLAVEDMEALPNILNHTQQRIVEAFDNPAETPRRPAPSNIEIPSFPVATMVVAAINDKYLKKRYALHEAKKAFSHLKGETTEKTLEIARHFKWDIEIAPLEKTPYQRFAIHFVSYLQNTTTLQESKWKLINREVKEGKVYVTKNEACRLLQEEIRKYIETKLNTKVESLPPRIRTITEKLKNEFIARKETIRLEEYPETVDMKAFPPCIMAMYNAMSSGHHLSHIGRFTLTTFLINVGMTTENVIDLFRTLSDFNERLTRYQVEHVAGQRGSRTKYIPPTCATLRTHGVCTNPDEVCRKVKHPLRHYKRKIHEKTDNIAK